MTKPIEEKMHFKQGLIIALITSATTILATLISTGTLIPKAEADSKNSVGTINCLEHSEDIKRLEAELNKSLKITTLSDLSNKFFRRDFSIVLIGLVIDNF